MRLLDDESAAGVAHDSQSSQNPEAQRRQGSPKAEEALVRQEVSHARGDHVIGPEERQRHVAPQRR